jgi:hypothetical protein
MVIRFMQGGGPATPHDQLPRKLAIEGERGPHSR